MKHSCLSILVSLPLGECNLCLPFHICRTSQSYAMPFRRGCGTSHLTEAHPSMDFDFPCVSVGIGDQHNSSCSSQGKSGADVMPLPAVTRCRAAVSQGWAANVSGTGANESRRGPGQHALVSPAGRRGGEQISFEPGVEEDLTLHRPRSWPSPTQFPIFSTKALFSLLYFYPITPALALLSCSLLLGRREDLLKANPCGSCVHAHISLIFHWFCFLSAREKWNLHTAIP